MQLASLNGQLFSNPDLQEQSGICGLHQAVCAVSEEGKPSCVLHKASITGVGATVVRMCFPICFTLQSTLLCSKPLLEERHCPLKFYTVIQPVVSYIIDVYTH